MQLKYNCAPRAAHTTIQYEVSQSKISAQLINYHRLIAANTPKVGKFFLKLKNSLANKSESGPLTRSSGTYFITKTQNR